MFSPLSVMKWIFVYVLTSIAILTVLVRVHKDEYDRSMVVSLAALGLLAIGILILIVWGIIRLIRHLRRIDLHTT